MHDLRFAVWTLPGRRTHRWPVSRVLQRARNWVLRKRPPLTGLDETLLSQRNQGTLTMRGVPPPR
jgi:hypothetical protein